MARFELTVREGPGYDYVALAEYVRARREGELDWAPDVLWTGLRFEDDEEGALWPPKMTFGDLPRIVIQLESAATRLERGDDALVRQAIDDTAEGALLHLVPASDDAVDVSIVVIAGVVQERGEYPASLWEDENEELYAYVAEHGGDAPDHWDASLLAPTRLPLGWMIERLAGEAALGREAHVLAGVEFDATRFG